MDDQEFEEQRTEALNRLLESDARLKVVVAGPGTGKTHALEKLLKQTSGEKVVLSFINNLVSELDDRLGDLAEVRTLHRYCRRRLHRTVPAGLTGHFRYFPPLSDLIVADINFRLGTSVTDWDVQGVLHTLDSESEILIASIESGDYYDAVSHTDAVYRMVRHLETHSGDIPKHAQVYVDEFQDFSPLEVRFIELLAQASPTLVVGDDDQALYAFKHASAEALRGLVTGGAYASFELPFSTRCTQVLVASVARVVRHAQEAGLLEGRIDKRFECYVPSKRDDNSQYSRILHAACTVHNKKAPYMARYIAQQIERIPKEDLQEAATEGYPAVLVVGPRQFVGSIYRYLAELFPSVEYKQRERTEMTLLDGYMLLLPDERLRLGWRVLVHIDQPENLGDIVRRAVGQSQELSDLLPGEYRRKHLALVDILRRIQDEEQVSDDEIHALEEAVGLSLPGIETRLRDDEEQPEDEASVDDDSAGNIAPDARIVVTNLVGAKGMQAGHVFVVGMNGRHFPASNDAPTNTEVCELIVALTRATKCCHVLSTGRFGADELEESVFLGWLADNLERVQVDKEYFKN